VISIINRLTNFIPNYSPGSSASASFLPSFFQIFRTSSNFRRVFQTSDEMKIEFIKFLKTIFYQLDEKKVLAKMEEILEDPNKTDEEIYNELLVKINDMKKSFAPAWQLWSLRVLKQGLSKQVSKLLNVFQKKSFNDYMEIYDRRYLKVIRKIAGLPLKGNTVAVSNSNSVGILDRLQAGALFSFYPYKTHVPLNDPDCENPLENPEKTHKPIGNEVEDKSIDLISCLGGLHHIPKSRLDAFVNSMHRKLRAGGVILLREHDISDNYPNLSKKNIKSIASLVHTFVNAADGVSWNVERNEVRDFRSLNDWTKFMKAHNFTRISLDSLILKCDPTKNAMAAFVKNPENLNELRQTTKYRKDNRTKDYGRSTWIEWGNVRFSNQYADFIQDHHSYAFDYIGHMRQHFKHFYYYIKDCLNDEIKLKDIIFSDNFGMNLFILFTTIIQCSLGYVVSIPSRMLAKFRYGDKWRDLANLTDLEKYSAKVEKEYSEFINTIPFYMFDYIGKIKNIWKVVLNSQEGIFTKAISIVNGTFWSLDLLLKAIVSMPVRMFYTSEENKESETVNVLIKDPNNELGVLIKRWEKDKDQQRDKNQTIEVIHKTSDGHKLVSFPRYRAFTKICSYLNKTSKLKLLEIGGQSKISVDVILKPDTKTPNIENARSVYEIEKLQDPQKRRYVTYNVAIQSLKEFQRAIGIQNVEYIHE